MNLNKQYASALISLSKETNSTDKIYSSSKFVAQIMNNRELQLFLSSYSVGLNQKHTMINAVFKKADNITINTIKLMCDKHQAKHIKGVFLKVRNEINKLKGIEEGNVFSSEELSNENIKKIEKEISIKISKKVELKNLIDKELISGIKVEVADTVFDYSAKGTLKKIKEDLLKETI